LSNTHHLAISRAWPIARRIFREAELAGNQDMRDASETYTGFLSLLKWGTIVSIAVTALVLLIIA
jgi:hypothetical protein